MSNFRYRGRSGRGDLITGRLEGDDIDAVATRLLNLGITPLEIEPDAIRSATFRDILERLGAGRPSTADLVLFSRQMYSITKSGLPLLKGLRGLAQSTHNTVLRNALHDVLQSLESGRDFASSLARHPDVFSPLFVSMVRVGESTGTLENSFARLCDYLGHDQDVQDRVKSALRYPLIVVAVIALAVTVITVFVIPNFAPLFKVLGNDIPWPTRVIMGTSAFVRHHGLAIAAASILGLFAFKRYVDTEPGLYRWDRFKLKVPVLGELLRLSVLSRVMRSLSISIEAGLPMIQALTLLSRSAGNEYLAEQLVRLRDAVERGEPLSHAAAGTGIFPPLVLQMILVGEETGELTRLLEEVSGFYQREVDYRLRNLTALLEPILIIGVGVMVLILALGVFLPMWNMIGKIGHTG
ncbi:MAG TPA: type II secretion system F family protein [Steroidobacteraceae bacterium]|nr:type II secretion system F family protein [Steroidobacteraceae bacterium]